MSARLGIATGATIALMLVLAGGASAQGFPDLGYMGSTIGAGGLQTSAMNTVIAQSVEQTHKPAPAPARQAQASTGYRASPQVSAKVRAQFAQHMTRQAGAEGGRKIAAAMQARDPVQNWAQLVAADGLRPGDAADALAGYWVLNWMIANRGDNNRAQTLAVRDQVRAIMTSNPAYARLGEAQRQEFAEVLMLNFLAQQAAYVDALKRGDQASLQRLGDAAVARFKSEMGVDLRRLSLTGRGFARN
ncbi:DUF6683 family protein [Caulobacter endophyticus]|uniref:Uncharacterized protein n=1 Tax=Caulobacter endophyticus TaxID=2172652 RepID=A0A2T9JU07_9CAUL|nr:DUF6683 family protein [Caulobacter endophyticus]PVM87197.1 hypothetical protein DDF67_14940 [Caulobacter endophyticus]